MKNTNKKILVLGGSYMQSGLIEASVKLGYDTYVIDKNANCLVSNNTNIKFNAIDISNVKDTEEYFLKNKIDFIIPPVSEIGNKTASIIAEKYGLAYNSVETVALTTNKKLMRQRLNNFNLNEPKTYNIKSKEDINTTIFNFPIFIKPSINSASRGVTEVNSIEELPYAVERALQYVNNIDELVFEEALKGEQYSLETISSRGKHYLVAITRENLSSSPFYMERMNIIIKEENEKIYIKATEFIEKLLNHLNVQFGPCHIEVKIDSSLNISLIEIASRSGMLRDRLINTAMGADYNELIIKAYLGEELSVPQKPQTNGMLGIIAYPEDLKIFKQAEKDGVVFEYFFNGNEMVDEPKLLTDAVGYFFIRSADDKLFNRYKVITNEK